MDRLRTAHPGFRANAAYPVGKTGDEPQILHHMLLANQADRHDPTGRYGERWPEEFLQVEYPGGMVAENKSVCRRPVSKVRMRWVVRCSTSLMKLRRVLSMPASPPGEEEEGGDDGGEAHMA